MRIIATLILSLAVHTLVQADELHVVVNGKAIHLDEGNYNEKNWGFGVAYDWAPRDNWIKFFNASYFKDSNNATSRYIGGGIKRRYHLENDKDGWRVDVGAITFLMTRKDYKKNDPFPGLLPIVALANGPVTLNMTYIPEVSPKYKDLLYFQLQVRIKTFE